MEFCCSWSIIYCGQIFEYLVEIGNIWLKIFETRPYSGWHSLNHEASLAAANIRWKGEKELRYSIMLTQYKVTHITD